jgi:hypothetical protein
VTGTVSVRPRAGAPRRHGPRFRLELDRVLPDRLHRILNEGLRVGAGDRLVPERRAAMARHVRERVGPYGWMLHDFAAGPPDDPSDPTTEPWS